MNSNEIRKKFLEFFRNNGHQIVPSDSLIPSNDPSLLFTSAGMVQFKKHFLGETRLEYRRAASSQKCLRTSDIEKVGHTARHLTFFEMLGNFSFGDYFKEDAIQWGWEFLTKTVALDPKKLYASIYKDDDEAFRYWKKFLPDSKIIRLGEDSNFWTMGPTGPCGPCSEILFDRGEPVEQNHACQGPGCDCDRYMEVWNLVFTQYDRTANGKWNPLPQKNIDTGMGLERLDIVINGLPSAFETDLFKKLDREIKEIIGDTPTDQCIRIVSDHIRACTFLISDGILPSNEGRGYILRRLLRRALRQGWTQGKKEPFLHKLSAVVTLEMGKAYPEISDRMENIQSIIKTEEKNSLETIETGTRTLEAEIEKSAGKSSRSKSLGKIVISGEKIFNIYDTYGLDKEIQKEIVRDRGGELIFSENEYSQAKEKAVRTARKGWKGSGQKDVSLYSKIHKKFGDTRFRGYQLLECPAKIGALLKNRPLRQNDGTEPPIILEEVKEISQNEEGEVILNQTPFYAESGGQVGDQGILEQENGKHAFSARVLDTQKPLQGLIVHRVKVLKGKISATDKVLARVDQTLRKHTMRHHTATHLLHASLRKILGKAVTQAGSLVSPEKLRFDFTYPRSVSQEEIQKIENDVNQAILSNTGRKRSEKSLENARKGGALAFFGDKYGSKVFVVDYGPLSTEVCGGTHCLATGEIGVFKILSENSVASGVRRIEAVAGEKALEAIDIQNRTIRKISDKLKCGWQESPEKIERILVKQSELEREVHTLKKKDRKIEMTHLANQAQSFPAADGTHKILVQEVPAMDTHSLRETADSIRDTLKSGVVLLASNDGDKLSFVVTLTPDCKEAGFHAGKIAKEFGKKIGGSGGGKELFAQGGGKNPAYLKEILTDFPKEIANTLKA